AHNESPPLPIFPMLTTFAPPAGSLPPEVASGNADQASIEEIGNADKASIEEIGDLEDVIGIFGPPDQPTRVVDASIQERPAGTTYYHYELTSPAALLSAYVSDSQIYIFQVSAPGLSKRQWRESFYLFDAMRDSFTNEARF
ncbi:unnamed protein product, partial [Closterium sp. NIES-54]